MSIGPGSMGPALLVRGVQAMVPALVLVLLPLLLVLGGRDKRGGPVLSQEHPGLQGLQRP